MVQIKAAKERIGRVRFMSTSPELYWAVQAGLIAVLLLNLALTLIPWQAFWAVLAIAEFYVIPTRLNDAGRRPWSPLVGIGIVLGALWLLYAWLVQPDDGGGSGLMWFMLSVVVLCVSAFVLVVWPGMLPSKPRRTAPAATHA